MLSEFHPHISTLKRLLSIKITVNLKYLTYTKCHEFKFRHIPNDVRYILTLMRGCRL